jgi:hypothetical protein
MKHPFELLILSLTAALALTSCDKEDAKKKGAKPATGIVGTWKLVSRACYCAPTPTPDETVVFTGTDFSFYKQGQLGGRGTYTKVPVSICGSSTLAPGLHFTYLTSNSLFSNALLTIKGDTLTLDYGLPCDAPRESYVRLASAK